MGVAACLVSLVLALVAFIGKFAIKTPASSMRSLNLSVRIRPDEPDLESQPESVDQTGGVGRREGAPLTETATVTEDVSPATPNVPQFDERPTVDWQNLIVETVASIGEESRRREESRERMRRTTHSVMFQPEGDYESRQQEPIIPDFRFKPQVHVAGLGMTIGSCFIGLPIVGVPVEDRTVAIRLFVCAKD